MKKENKINILGIKFLALSKIAILTRVKRHLEKKTGTMHIITANPEMIIASGSESIFRNLMEKSFVVADGIGVLWAATFLDKKIINPFIKIIWLMISLSMIVLAPRKIRQIIPSQIHGRKLWLDVCRLAEKNNHPVFLIGTTNGLSTFVEIKSKLQTKYPDLRIEGDFTWNKSDKKYIQNIDNQIKKNAIVFASIGHPEQDMLCDKLKTKTKIWMGVGGSFDFFLSKQIVAPNIMQNLGLEWLWRLIRQPRRIKRIWIATGRFIYLVWKAD